MHTKKSMDKKIIFILALLGVAIIGVVTWGVVSSKKANAPAVAVSGTIYYFGAECPHCKKINEFLESENIAEKVSFIKKEVWHDKGNASEMVQAAAQCNINKSDIGVPFIFDNGTCFIGEPDVKKFFSDKAGIAQ